MLIWLEQRYKGRTIRNDKIGMFRFIMPFYEEWFKMILNGKMNSQLVEEFEYMKRKREDDWYVIYNQDRGYLLIDNRTRTTSYTKEPKMFIDTRIPFNKVGESLSGYGYNTLHKNDNKDEILEYSIENVINLLENINER
ncbi:hypothetical protein KHQ81_06330 [Mycoplasmatota bacterium]|nr:hypothetical protein KHQ81_06330 [Mycoplasmatota bacterium]